MSEQLVVGLVGDNVLVRPLQVCLNAPGWLRGHLEAALQDRFREVIDRHRRQDQPKVLMDIVVLDELGHDDLELGHPRLVQVTVLQEDPVSLDLAFGDQSGGLGPLPRAETHDPESAAHALALGVVADLLHRVDSLAQHEDDWIIGQRGTEQGVHRANGADGVLGAQLQL